MYDPSSHNLLRKVLEKHSDKKLDEAFKLRLSAGFHTIFQNFHKLYPLRPDVWQHLEGLIEVLIATNIRRNSDLQKIDENRSANPQWFLSEKIVGMMLYVDLFNKDLKGLLKKIDYLQELGVNLIHIMPILKMPVGENDGGYAVSDYQSVDPRFGSMEMLEKVADALRKKDMFMMMDMVINHTADDHQWAKEAKSGNSNYQDFYYFFEDRTLPDQYEQSLPQVFPDTSPGNFTWVEETQSWVMTVFNSYQWDLNYTNPAVFNAMLENLLFLANQGADILRMDALAFMWKQLGTDSQNLPHAHLLIQTFKACIQIARPGTIFLAEAIVAPEEIIKYFGQSTTVSNECDLAYNATLMTLLWESVTTKNNRLLKVSLENIPSKPLGTSWITYLRCHDDIGLGYEDEHARWAGYDGNTHRRFIIDYLTSKIDWSVSKGLPFMEDPVTGDARISGTLASLAGLEKAIESRDNGWIQLAVKRIQMMHAIILSYGGIPMLYMGDEIGMLNDYSYTENPEKKGDNRWVHRPSMNWDQTELRHVEGTVEHSIFNSIKELVDIRKNAGVFADHNNTYLVDVGNEHVLAFGRYRDHQKVICVFNLNDQEEWFSVDHLKREGLNIAEGLIDMATGLYVDQPYNQIKLLPFQFHWLEQRSIL